jgi:hypothetical protein
MVFANDTGEVSRKKKVSHLWYGIFAVPFVIFLWLFFPSFDQLYAYAAFKKAEWEGKDEIYIKDLTYFDWDAVCYESAYGEEDKKGKYYHLPIKKEVDIPAFYRGWGLVFIKNGIAFKFFRPLSPKFPMTYLYQMHEGAYGIRYCISDSLAKFTKTALIDEKTNAITPEYTFTYLETGRNHDNTTN